MLSCFFIVVSRSMYLKSVGWKLEVWKDFTITQIDPFSIDDQDFVNELKWTLFVTLSENPSWLIEKYAWIYFTWYEDIDKQILLAISSLVSWFEIDNKLESINGWLDDKMNKLLFILKNTIIKGILL